MGFAVAGVIDMTNSSFGLPGAEYIGMFGVVWLLFRNLDKREDRELQERAIEIARLEELTRAVREGTEETRELRQAITKHIALTRRVIKAGRGDDN